MAIALETVVKQLTDSGIIAPGKLENFVPPKADPKDGETLLRELHKQGLLTTFQAQQVAANKIRALILGGYILIDRIGAGGMGQVFKAQHRKMERIVAIKMLPKAMLEDAAAAARFQREVVAASKLLHPNIVSAFDAAEANGVHFLVMEYVEGQDLSALVKKDGPLPVGKAVNYILQAARGLEFAHSKGVIHRDIKPANLLLSTDGTVKILDMGLARIEGDAADHQLTSSGTIMGTVDFMAPEQAISTRNADARADIYSLGISLYYLLAAKPAYGGETAIEKLMAHQTQPIPSLQDAQTTVPKQLDAVFKKMVAKKIEDRYQSMTEVIEALERLGIGTTSTKKGEVASTLALSPEQKKKLAAQAKKKPLSAITGTVASEQTRNLVLKIVGGAFGTIIAPILVFYLIRHLEKAEKPAAPPAATAPAASEPPVVVATNTTTQPPAHVEKDDSPKPLVAPFDTKQAHAGQAAWAKHLGTKVETINSVGIRLTLIPPGEFLMGSTPEQNAIGRKMGEDDKIKPDDLYFQRLSEEMPQHKVTISQPFLMGSTEVTVAQFRKFVEATNYVTDAEKHGIANSGDKAIEKAKEDDQVRNWKNPGYAVTDDTAVTQITWNDAVAYCAWLSEQEQRRPWYRPDGKGGWLVAAHADGYRLPTEAEWEYACRAGTTTQYSFGDDKSQLEQYGWFKKNAGRNAHPVALKRPNPFGLFDIHGNAQEWCQDRYDGKWYEKSSPSDPAGPSSGSLRVIRGGHWSNLASSCRSVCRYYHSPTYRPHYTYDGFRCVRVADGPIDSQLATNTTTQPTTPVTAATTQPSQPWNTPAFQAWVKEVQAMPAEQQIEAVSKKLMELNPGFDGKLTGYDGNGGPKIDELAVTELGLTTDSVRDLSPLRAFARLKSLDCSGSGSYRGHITELSPLQGLPLVALQFNDNRVSSLAALQGMPLKQLSFYHTGVSDLSPLMGMSLSYLTFHGSPVSDLTPLSGMPLVTLHFTHTKVSDLSPLKSCRQLTMVRIGSTQVTPEGVADLLKALPNCKTDWSGVPAKPASTNKLAYVDPAFQKWVADTQKLPAEKQIEAFSKKLMELNPGFDGKVMPDIEKGVVTGLDVPTDKVSDISPIRAFTGLKKLLCNRSWGNNRGRAMLSDLAPLEGMRLQRLDFADTAVSDLSPLSGMPLTQISLAGTPVTDLSPLKGMKLKDVTCYGTQVTDLSPLAGMPLWSLGIESTPVSDLSPLRGMALGTLRCFGSKVSDLTPLDGTRLTEIRFTPRNITSGLDNLRQMKGLTSIGVGAEPNQTFPPAEFWKKYDAGEFGKPAAPAKLTYLDPAFQLWVKTTQALPAEKQIEAVSKKLMELNPGFDGKVDPKIDNGVVTEFAFHTDSVTDIAPVRALPGLKKLGCAGSGPGKGKMSELAPLQGMKLAVLDCGWSPLVVDLSALKGMPLTYLNIGDTGVADLSPLQGMNLNELRCGDTAVSDLSSLIGMNLASLNCDRTQVSDLSPLRGMKLRYLYCQNTPVSAFAAIEGCDTLRIVQLGDSAIPRAAVAALQKALPNCKIEWDALTRASPAGDGAKPRTPEPAASGTK